MHYSVVHDTRKGTRATNQDRVAYSENQNGIFMVIADGMGGHARGDAAAQITVDTLIDSFNRRGQERIDDPAAFIVLSMNFAHMSVNRMTRLKGLEGDMPRTTCVACLVQNGYAYWGHVGDSRLYLFGDGELLSRTVDHTTTDHLHQDGVVDENYQRLAQGQVFRCIGGNKRPVVSLGPETQLGDGDTILLCTDGVWRAFKEEQLLVHADSEYLEDGVEDMLDHAQRFFRQACDNLTALLFRWEDEPSQHKPLYNLGTPELDQEKLWHSSVPKPAAAKAATVRPKRRTENIDSVIAEIESFINGLDSVIGPDRQKGKSD